MNDTAKGMAGLGRQQIVGCSSIALVAIVAVFGGGGSSALPGFEAICHFAGFALLALLVATGRGEATDPAAAAWLALAMLAFLLPAAQLMPLPAGLLASLPGRELAGAIQADMGAMASSPFTLDPDRTIISALSLVPAIALFAATLRCNRAWRERLALAWIALAVIAVFVGALQVASGGTAVAFYDTPHRDDATGFFANRNHNSIFLLASLVLFVTIAIGGSALESLQSRGRASTLLRLAVAILLCAGMFITTSRAGLLLLLLSVPALAALLMQGRRLPRLRWPVGAAIGFVLAALLTFFWLNPVAREVIGRFSLERDPRWAYWPDVVHTLGQFWPAGSGIGTFEAVFATQERLETVNRLYINHAHNDYLELAIEGGIVAVILMLAFAVLLALRARSIAGWGADASRRIAMAAMLAIVLILLHSLVDYPLRAITILCLFGYLSGLLFRPPAADAANQEVR